MHNCRKTKKKLVDLVFGELETHEQQRAPAEVESCAVCAAEYHAMLATLRAFDQAADAAMPEESYWAGYEARLRVKLNQDVAGVERTSVRSGLVDRLKSVPRFLLAKPAIPATVAALILLAAISTAWISRRGTSNPQVFVAGTTPTPQPTSAASPTPQANKVVPESQTTVAVKVPRPRRSRPAEPVPASTADTVAVADPATHLENAQLLLRSFRNADSVSLAYEKRQARKLVYDNILLRREAEAKGNLPVEEALNSLEPLLLDIANLPAKPARGDLLTIRERIQKQEIIATLQIVGTGLTTPERFGAPAVDQE